MKKRHGRKLAAHPLSKLALGWSSLPVLRGYNKTLACTAANKMALVTHGLIAKNDWDGQKKLNTNGNEIHKEVHVKVLKAFSKITIIAVKAYLEYKCKGDIYNMDVWICRDVSYKLHWMFYSNDFYQ